MNLSGLLPVFAEQSALQQAEASLKEGRSPVTLATADAVVAPILATLAKGLAKPLLVVTAHAQGAQNLAEQIAAWLDKEDNVMLFPERDPLPYERLLTYPQWVKERLTVLARLNGQPASEDSPIIVASARAVSQKTLTAQEAAEASLTLKVGHKLSMQLLWRLLAAWGYRPSPLVEQPGEAARRGGLIDLFPPTMPRPVRIELLGNRIDSLRYFDAATQRSQETVEEVIIGPAREMLLPQPGAGELLKQLDFSNCNLEVKDRYQRELTMLAQGEAFDGDDFYVPFLAQGSLLEHLPPQAVLVCHEPEAVAGALEEADAQSAEARRYLEEKGELPGGLPLPHWSPHDTLAALARHPRRLDLRPLMGQEGGLRLPTAPASAYGGRLEAALADIAAMRQNGSRLIIVSQQMPRLAELMAQQGLDGVTVVQGSLPQGFTLGTPPSLTVLTDAELFGTVKQRRATPKGKAGSILLSDISPGDYVVHVEHGVAVFRGLTRRAIDGVEREYLELHYAQGDKLFVPTDHLDRVAPYVGPSDRPPAPTRLGSGEWPRVKERVQRAVAQLAQELLSLYAARQVVPGYAFSPDTVWQQELEAAFPYVETPDQLEAIRAVKQEMESPTPMDRLVCGDVGYGKTEVAVRAAFKAVMDGKQVAMLVPTTILAQQHFRTFSERLAAFPIRVEMLSRFRHRDEQRQVVKDLAHGAVDIVIGTHRLLQKDVHFKDLGLVIIDEEQRFGVAHKERLKQMRQEVDVLTLSATPIPRTLYMSLVGIRDMSTMETPPEERLPIKTYVMEYNPRVVREAILRELERGGQVYFVHNRVHSIGRLAHELAELVPEARIAVGHGQMPEDKLERVMLDFLREKVDVLVCTTIIESGLDMPNVNTIIVSDAHRLGLAQLYQLRGRVGRGAQRAYAYLMYPRRTRLTDTARRRLQTIFEAAELGAGFQIALRDLEIRGAGNLLGAEQSGHISAVGFHLYMQLLAEAVERLKALQQGEKPKPRPVPITVDLPLSAHIPEDYVSEESVRLALYRRMADAESLPEVDDLEHELRDRFGPLPQPVLDLLWVLRLRPQARQGGVRSMSTEDGQIVVRLAPGKNVPKSAGHHWGIGVQATTTQVRLDLRRLGKKWREVLEGVIWEMAACCGVSP